MFILNGCYGLYAFIYDLRPIQMHNDSSLSRFMLEKHIDSNDVFKLKNEYVILSLKNDLNRAFIYDKSGFRIDYDWEIINKKCHGNILMFLKKYAVEENIPIDSGNTFAGEIVKWISLSGKEINPRPEQGKDITIVYYWNTFSGNPNHKLFMRKIENIISARKDLKIRFYKINQDVQKE